MAVPFPIDNSVSGQRRKCRSFLRRIFCDDELYTGWTNDPEARLKAHQSGKGAKYTRTHTALSFAYLEACADKSAALRREIALKKLTKAQKEALCAGWTAEKE